MHSAKVMIAFVLGACSTAAVQSAAGPAQPAANADAPANWLPPMSDAIVRARDVEHRVAPNGKGSVSFLARGHNAFVAQLELAADAAIPLHRDATEEYIHVLQGGGTITIDGAQFAIERGDTVYMAANAEVSYQNGASPMVAIQVFAGPEPASKYATWSTAK